MITSSFLFCLYFVNVAIAIAVKSPGKHILIDTDLLNFPDDVGALGVAHILQNSRECNILGIASGIGSTYAPPAIDSINTYYKRPNIPIALNRPINQLTHNPYYRNPTADYITHLADPKKFPHDLPDGSKTPTPLELYRSMLAQAPKQSITIVAIGFFNNLHELYNSPPDKYSPLSGKDLIADKVQELVVQGGRFSDPKFSPRPHIGYNLAFDLQHTKLVDVWPTPLTYLGAEIGGAIQSGAGLTQHPDTNPVKAAYRIFERSNDIVKSDGSWDLVAVYYAVRGLDSTLSPKGTFSHSEPGKLIVHEDQTMSWSSDPKGQQRYLRLNVDPKALSAQIEKLLTAPPGSPAH